MGMSYSTLLGGERRINLGLLNNNMFINDLYTIVLMDSPHMLRGETKELFYTSKTLIYLRKAQVWF